MSKTIAIMQRMQDLMTADGRHDSPYGATAPTSSQDSIDEVRDHLADFDDFFRPIRNYFYWEPHCFDIPLCWSIRSIFDALDGIDLVTDKMEDLVKDLDQLDVLMPQMLLQFPQMIATMQNTRTMMLTMHSTMGGIVDTHGRVERQPDGHGKCVRRRPTTKTRSIWPPDIIRQQRGLQADHEDFHVAGRQGGAHVSSRRTSILRRLRASRGSIRYKVRPKRRSRARRWKPPRSISLVPRRRPKNSVDGSKIRSPDRGSRGTLSHLHHHADHDAQSDRRTGHRRHGGAFAGRVLRIVRAGLAIPSRHPVELGGAGHVASSSFWRSGPTTTCCWSRG